MWNFLTLALVCVQNVSSNIYDFDVSQTWGLFLAVDYKQINTEPKVKRSK